MEDDNIKVEKHIKMFTSYNKMIYDFFISKDYLIYYKDECILCSINTKTLKKTRDIKL
jgi:hypothetical protein